MSASKHIKIFIPLVSAMSLLALSAQAQEARPPREAVQPPAGPAAGAPPQSNQNVRRDRPPQQAARPAPQPGRHYARGPVPERDWGGHAYRGNRAWDGGRWRHEVRNGRSGWWWDVGGVWYYYPQRMAGPPAYISEEYYDDVPVAYAPAPPPVAYAAPPPPPPPADPGASALGGAIVGGLLGGLISGNATGAAAGAVVGGATGAIAGATAASQPGYYWAQGTCYYRYPNGQYVQADPRACY
ncbi:hypothetical protein [Bradyrhizobium sp. DOA9]|uniref:hypothetical protein n=1 Tax=Bradyrhizobium sp. DOA9 TaxID=1126627 RepID=UPI00046AABD5|nr:hypothetical protein [Bradyrhizobium sp. DOA9]GAJ35231.1 hypothetical protein BDOA9_0144320 [Bradyrhizobium sp. DOA9]